MKPVDAMINLNRKPNESELQILEQALRKTKGVVAPWFTPHLKQVVIVYYNPELINTTKILLSIRKLGYKASVVSL